MTLSKQQEEIVFDTARSLSDPVPRQAFLDQACAGDPGLRARVEGLLSAQAEAEEFFRGVTAVKLARSVVATDAALLSRSLPSASSPAEATITEAPGTRIGRFKLLQRIGEGGCGIVYMAEQEEPVRRRVAFKIIKLGMDTKSVIARFEAERQALALMDHTNIARVFDAGATDTGRPYFVMELVRGVRITDYCDQNHLDTRRRLELFIQICHAIQHAHQKGIIHRDIKPSNILVTLHDGVPVPKVIDFGIAKATEMRLTDKTLFTAYEQFVGTPAYMSPEQAEMSGLDVDTRSDIYSLGVLLYELLTSKTPFDGRKLLQSGLDELRRTLRETEPQRPSMMVTTLQGEELTMTAERREAEPPKLVSLLRGDLDWIVMKALEKDRRRRYETANGLAMDIERYLSNEPVIARPPSRIYRFQKLVRRNRGVFTAAGAVAGALIIGLGVSTWLFLREREARQRAVAAELQQARERQEAEQARANEAQLRRQAEARERITQAILLVREDRFDEADELLAKVSVLEPMVESAAVFRAIGEWHALQNRWKQAADRFTTLLHVNQLDGWDAATLDFLECGPAVIETGDTNRYEQFRETAIARFGGTTYRVADRIVKISLLLPASPQTLASLVPLADVAAKSLADADSASDVFQAAWRSVSLALWSYRQGDFPGAIHYSRRCLAYPENIGPRTATAHLILALSHHQLGHPGEATSELIQGRDLVDGKFRSGLDRGSPMQGFWFDWVFARILLREATALVPGPSETDPHSTDRTSKPAATPGVGTVK
jgi:eukaryotic-like serine/threonine-protein kinase